jgi:hypothetical protein
MPYVARCMTGNDHSDEDLYACVLSQLLPRYAAWKQIIKKNIFYLYKVKF